MPRSRSRRWGSDDARHWHRGAFDPGQRNDHRRARAGGVGRRLARSTQQAAPDRRPRHRVAGLGAPRLQRRPRDDARAGTRRVAHPGLRHGARQIDWRDARSALSTVAPLGSYRLRITGAGAPPTMELVTLSGPLQMQGKGTMQGSRIRFNGIAGAEPAMWPALNGLLGVLGMRSGDKVLLAIDT